MKKYLYLQSQLREHSSVGLEHLPYKQRVGGSTPSAPTKEALESPRLFSFLDSFRYMKLNNKSRLLCTLSIKSRVSMDRTYESGFLSTKPAVFMDVDGTQQTE